MPRFEQFVSRRYLFSRASRALVSIITFISIAGVTVGVAALIIVIGVIEGIDRQIFGKLVDLQPHAKITRKIEKNLADPGPVLEALKRHPEVVKAEPVISKQVLFSRIESGVEKRVPGRIIAAARLGKGELYNIPNMSDGSDITLGFKEVLLGLPLMYHLGSRQGTGVFATTGMLVRTANDWHPRMRELTVAGNMNTGIWDFDQVTAFVSPETARDLFGMETEVDYVHAKLSDPYAVRKFKAAIESELGGEYSVTTWEEENGEFFQALKMEKLGLTVILFLVVIVASFNIIGTLILLVIEKKPEIGTFKALGASDGMIHRTFLSAGLTIGIMGTCMGVTLGLIGCQIVPMIPLGGPESSYNMTRLPTVTNPSTVAIIAAASLVTALLAAYFPAAQAARLDPVEALRHD